jgi:hypothetical protein
MGFVAGLFNDELTFFLSNLVLALQEILISRRKM